MSVISRPRTWVLVLVGLVLATLTNTGWMPPPAPASSAPGAMPAAAAAPRAAAGALARPVDAPTGDRYGGKRNHPGVDFPAAPGTPVRAAAAGTVLRAEPNAGWNGGYGNLVTIDHTDGVETRYAHLSTVAVNPGATVEQGQVIGGVGSTGDSSGPHLHFETYVNGERRNPADLGID